VDPDSSRVRVTVTDGRGRPVRDGGLARWLARVAPPRVRGAVAVALVSDRHIRELNHRYRGQDTATDVLSFPAANHRIPNAERRTPNANRRTPNAERRIPNPDTHLGDIVIATSVARRQAREAGHSDATELRVLALHGLLHLLGYDHERADDRGRMARVEARLRRRGGLREGLIARETASRRRA
jgi:probable rRNA maturation factor